MALLQDRFSVATELLAQSVEDLAGYLLDHFNTLRTRDHSNFGAGAFDLHSIAYRLAEGYALKGFHRTDDVKRAIAEAWSWLVRAGLLVSEADHPHNRHFMSKQALALRTPDDLEEFRKRRLISGDILHPSIRDCSWGDYLKGDYETAILKAYRKVEVEVRTAGGFGPGESGVQLMRNAFRPGANAGPLTDVAELPGEQEALGHLFSGAIGRYRNPSAHGTGVFNDPIETAELLLLASQLMRIVDRRRKPPTI
jgi:uncharacterized protein (TIGR02391 family)